MHIQSHTSITMFHLTAHWCIHLCGFVYVLRVFVSTLQRKKKRKTAKIDDKLSLKTWSLLVQRICQLHEIISSSHASFKMLFWIKWCHLRQVILFQNSITKKKEKEWKQVKLNLTALKKFYGFLKVEWFGVWSFFSAVCLSAVRWWKACMTWPVGESGLCFPPGFSCDVCHLIHFNLCCPVNPGRTCDSIINHCECNPCFNGGSCQNRVDGYYCHCPFGE